jgi:hypothetical protein
VVLLAGPSAEEEVASAAALVRPGEAAFAEVGLAGAPNPALADAGLAEALRLLAGVGGSGMGREERAGAKSARSARSAAVIRLSRGLSNCIHSL